MQRIIDCFIFSAQLYSTQFHVIFHTFYNSLFIDFYAIVNHIQTHYYKGYYYSIQLKFYMETACMCDSKSYNIDFKNFILA